jgi:polar amino acid transport system substrate-binding protein
MSNQTKFRISVGPILWKLMLALSIAWLLGGASGCSPKAGNRLVVGMELAYPPFEMTDEKGQPSGISVEMAQALAAQLGQELQIENIPFDGLIPALKTGKIDLIISSMTATAERAQSIDFSEPYLKTGLCLLLRKDSTAQSIQDLDRPQFTIAVKKGTTGHLYAVESLRSARLLVLDKEADAVLEVLQKKADAFIYDQMSIFKHWQRNPDTTRAILQPFQEESWAVGLRKGNDSLRQKVNAFLDSFRARGGFNELGEKYLKEQKEAFRQAGIAFYF